MGLREVFEDPRTTTRDAALLAQRARVTLKSAQAFLRASAASQVSRVLRRPPDDAYAPTGGHEGEYLADVIYLRDYSGVNKHRGAILTLLGVNSRYAYARGLVMDASDKSRGVSAAKTTAAMESILAENESDRAIPIAAVRADGGPEFKGQFAALLDQKNITLERGQAGTHERLARLDRFPRHAAKDDWRPLRIDQLARMVSSPGSSYRELQRATESGTCTSGQGARTEGHNL